MSGKKDPDQLIYLIKSGNGLYKVGKTRNLAKRIRDLQTGNPNKLEIVDSFQTDDPGTVEAILHDMLSPYHVKGEWFRIPKGKEPAIFKQMRPRVKRTTPKDGRAYFRGYAWLNMSDAELKEMIKEGSRNRYSIRLQAGGVRCAYHLGGSNKRQAMNHARAIMRTLIDMHHVAEEKDVWLWEGLHIKNTVKRITEETNPYKKKKK
jgi:hypothetical protein